MYWKRRRVLVTGATGLVGGWLVKHLLEREASVLALVRDHAPKSLLLEECYGQVPAVHGDIRDADLVLRAMAEYEIEVVFHLAAQTIVPIANIEPEATWETNVGGTLNVMNAARRLGPQVKSIVFASSDKAYGDQGGKPYFEDMPLRAEYPYDASKAAAESVCASYAASYGVPVAILRCGNFFGGGDLNFNRIVPGTIRACYDDQRPVIRSDGSYVRDYLYVEDGALAYMHLAEQLDIQRGVLGGTTGLRRLLGQAFNVSYGEPLNVIELASRIQKLMGKELPLDIRGEASREIPKQVLDSSRFRALGWEPRYSVATGLERTVAWYKTLFQRVQNVSPTLTTLSRGQA